MRLIALSLAAGLAFAGAPALAQQSVTEISCHAVSSDGSERTLLIGRPLLERTADAGAFHLNTPAGMDVGSILCVRSSPVPAEHDYEILMDGYPLYISTGTGDAHTLTLLEVADQQFRLRIVEGSLTGNQRAMAAQRLEHFTNMVNSGS